jgi:hypothetical protein
MATKIQLRRGTASQWTSANPTLSSGEAGFETDTGKLKIGNGSTAWNSLSYASVTSSDVTTEVNAAIATLVDSAPGALNTLNELAAAINDDANFFTTVATNLSNHENDTTSIHGISNTANLVYTNDSRLSDARTPTSHASSHESGGSDAITIAQSQVTNLSTDLSDKAPLSSPNLTGTPTAPTANQGSNSTQIATTAYVDTAASNATTAVLGNAPSNLNTLGEIASSINNDATFSTTVNNALALKAPLASPELTGTPTAPTATAGNNSTQIATTAYADTAAANAASALVDSAPSTLNTLNELAAALGDDPSYATTITTALGGKEPTITSGTTSQYWRGDKSWQTLDKSAVGLSDVENTAISTWTGSSNITTVGTLTNLTVTNTITGSISGNSATVTNGVYTTGSYADPSWITSLSKSKVGLSNVEDTALSTWAGSSSVTTVGTIATGVWQGSEISTTYTVAKVTSVNGSTGAVTGLATTTGNLSQFSSTTSLQLAEVISDETGSGSLVFGTSPTLSTAIMLSPEERCNIVASAATGTINFNVLTSTIWLYTSNATADHTLNFRGNSENTLNSLLSVGDSISLIWLNTNGSSAFRPTAFQIDGVNITPRWSGGTAPTAGNANSIDAYSFSIIKTSAEPTYTVLAGQSRFA